MAETTTEVSSSDGGQETTPPETWPEDSYGAFYLEPDVPLGVPGMYLAFLSNLELSPTGMLVTHLSCRGEAYDAREQFELEFEGAQAHVRPREGDTMVMWRGSPLAAELILRPGSSCRELELELIDPDPSTDSPDPWQWHRGTLVVTDVCEPDEVWAFDLRSDVPTECGSG